MSDDINFPLVYDWRGHLVEVEVFEGPVELPRFATRSHTRVPDGETWVLMWFKGTEIMEDGVYIPYEKFAEVADPVGVDALSYEGVEPFAD